MEPAKVESPLTDLIAAVATAPGQGGICVIRVSGPNIAPIAHAVLGFFPRPRYAHYAQFIDTQTRQVIDKGMAIYFPSPHSFTGECVLELQGHGGVVISQMILESVLCAGARLARPGEFSERAFINNKLDLVQAEGIADLIAAGSKQAAKAALRTMEGEFSRHIKRLLESLIDIRVHVESSLDFSDEPVELLSLTDMKKRLAQLIKELAWLIQLAQRGRILGEGIDLVIGGHPNVGKSSLMNRLSGRDSAIVTDIPGTTRDIIQEQITLLGLPMRIQDTAGLRHHAGVIEQEGIRRAKDRMEKADIVLWVCDDTKPISEQKEKNGDQRWVRVLNKIDLSGRVPGLCKDRPDDLIPSVAISAKSGTGIEQLKQVIARKTGLSEQENEFSARQRHLLALNQTQAYLQQALEQLKKSNAGELIAEELRLAQQALSEITGQFSSDDLLGEIFSQFCIGK